MTKYSEISQYETMKIQSRNIFRKCILLPEEFPKKKISGTKTETYKKCLNKVFEFQGILNYNHCANESSKIPCWTFNNSPVLYFYLYSYLFLHAGYKKILLYYDYILM